MNLGEIQRYVHRFIRKPVEDDADNSQITNDDITRWANHAQLDIARKTEAFQEVATLAVAANTETANVPDNLIFIRRATWDGKKLAYHTLEDVEQLYPNRDFTATSGTPQRYWIFNKQIYLHPIPSVAGTLRLFYVRAPVLLAAAADELTLPDQMHEEVLRYVLARAKEFMEEFAPAQYFSQDYEQRLAQAKSESRLPDMESYPVVKTLPEDDWGWG